MIRMVLENVLLFLAPTALYIGYVYLVRQGETAGRDVLAEAPLAWLVAAGATAVVLVMVLFGSTEGESPSQGYEPPSVKDGQIVHGHRQ